MKHVQPALAAAFAAAGGLTARPAPDFRPVSRIAPLCPCVYILHNAWSFGFKPSRQPPTATPVVHSYLHQMADKRVKCCISYNRCNDLLKEHVDVVGDHYLNDDHIYIVKAYKAFFLAVSKETPRLNGVALKQAAKNLFKLSNSSATLFGTSLAASLAYVKKAGDKATTGEKLSDEVVEVYENLQQFELKMACQKFLKREPASSVKREPGVKEEQEYPQYGKRVKLEMPSTPPRGLKKSMSSPSQVAALYGGLVIIKEEEEEQKVPEDAEKEAA